MRKLFVGVQSFQEIIESNYIYVDKTHLIYNLIKQKGYYFLSRPRRFGKTLLVETLESIFQGEKKLFEGYQIANTDYDWEKYPVIRLDFALMVAPTAQELKDGLEIELANIEEQYEIPHKSFPSASHRLTHLVRTLSKQNRVVVLIDEYDKPIVDNLHRIEVAESNRDTLQSFFGVLKSLHKHLRFVFITGVSKFSQVSLFSGLNNAIDLTMRSPYEELLGYTEKEIRLFYKDYLEKLVRDSPQPKTIDQVIDKMREWYNGYRFSSREITLYNPHSVMSFLENGVLENYWFRTGTPSFLIEHIENNPIDLTRIRDVVVKKEDLCDIYNLRKIDQRALMWQTGYLTIHSYDPIENEYTLDFPNKEVQAAFFRSLMKEILDCNASETSQHATKCREELESINLTAFFERISTLLAKLPYHLFMKGIKEGVFHAFFLLLLEAMEIRAHPEDPTNIGRADLSVEMEKVIYIFEFKADKTSEVALSQIEQKQYLEKYLKGGKEIALVGVDFSTQIRNISSWNAAIYTAEGIKKEELRGLKKGLHFETHPSHPPFLTENA